MTKPEKTEPRWVAALLVLFAAGLTLFQLLTASPLWIVSGYKQAGIHWAFIAAVFLLSKPTKGRTGPVVDFLLLAASLACVYGLFSASDTLANASGLYSRLEVALAICQIFLALIIGYKALGKALPLIAIVFLLYTLYSNKIPGMFKTAKVSLSRLAPYLLVGSEGMFGTALVTCSRFIFIFIFFGAVLDLIGAGSFFVDLAFSLTGRAKGGAAQASIYSSMLMGMISGSGPANVVTTGTFTIPLMKKIGFDKDTAGAVEAVASGQDWGGTAFTSAYFYHQRNILPFMERFGLEKRHFFGQEGILAPNYRDILSRSPEEIAQWVELAKKYLEVPELLAFAEHAMYIGRKPR